MMHETTVTIEAAREAGKILLEHFNKAHTITEKGKRDFVTEVDLKSEEKIISILRKEFPNYSILAEESGQNQKDSEFMWIIDPLDGTKNYSIKNPFFNVSIGLAKGNSIVSGVVFAPITNEMFYAEKGKGAFLNGKQIQVSHESSLQKSLVAYCHGKSDEDIALTSELFTAIKPYTLDYNRMRAAALELALVAAGRVNAYLAHGTNAWDVGAGSLLVQEAGGIVTNFENKEWTHEKNDILASNGKIHDELLEKIKETIKKKL